jgi:U3 small nucleolar RNA-associated protein 19
MERLGCSDAWLAFLRLPIPEDLFKRLLQVLTSTVLPNIRNPVLLSDFLTHAVMRGGLIGILAMHGLFVLVTQHGLEYPRFYEQLYGLLTPQVRGLQPCGPWHACTRVT